MTPLSSPSVTAIICAAGKGERAGMNGNKLFAPLYGGVSASAKNETKREKTAENGRMERMSGQCERADETNKRATRTEGKDGSADTTERNFRTEEGASATDDVNGRNEQTGNADGRAQTDKPIRADGRTERTDGRTDGTDGRTDGTDGRTDGTDGRAEEAGGVLKGCVLEKTISAFDIPAVTEILVTASETDFEEISALCARFPRTRVVLGGKTRSDSVRGALKAATGEIVLVHDGARPFVSEKIISGCISSVSRFGSGICAVLAVDTVAVSENGYIGAVPPRDKVFALQTPQGFYTEELRRAYTAAEKEGGTYTDDSSVYAAFIGAPRLCEGSRENKKLTFPEDFSDNYARAGFGVDTHAFGKKQDFILLAGVKIPSESGLVAHSDGDVLAHAVMDALLSAAGLKDIGHYFPDKDEKWRDADSMQMLREVRSLIAREGFAPKNLSVAVQAEKPRLAKFIDQIKSSLARALGLDCSAVGVSAGTNEGLGYVGEGKGITVNAYVLLRTI